MKAYELHAFPLWNEAIEAARKELGVPLTDLQGLSAWLQEVGEARFLRVAELTFRMLNLSDLFFAYFAACILTDHKGARYIHALPTELLVLANRGGLIHPSPRNFVGEHDYAHPARGYFRISYAPRPDNVPPGWVTVGIPCGFEVWWPNVISPFGTKPGVTNWQTYKIAHMVVEVKAYEFEDELYILPFTFGPGVAGRTPPEVFPRIPRNAKIFKGVCHLPLITFPDLMGGVALDTAIGRSRWQEPKVIFDASASKEDRERAKVWENFIKHSSVIPEEVWPKEVRPERGRPHRDKPAPGMSYLERLEILYREKINRFSRRPLKERLKKLRDAARRQARKDFPRLEQRESVPSGFWERIEAEVWGKRI
ncbi:MAG: hypothetical protein ACUVTQ_09605 [Desulfotomaculales bacterium]